MKIEDYSFHDSLILEVKENTTDQTLEFLFDFPVDWDNNIFAKRILRFKNIIYSVSEIPFAGPPAIMQINNFGITSQTFGTGRNVIEAKRNKIEIITNAGNRILKFSECELLEPAE